jgi:hypothetical protein
VFHGDLPRSTTVLAYRFVQSEDTGLRPAAVGLFIDFADAPSAESRSEDPWSQVPKGLWGMGARGQFSFDVCVIARTDGLVATGYSRNDGPVDRIRVDRNGDGAVETLWRRGISGTWSARTNPTIASLLDPVGFSPQEEEVLESILDEVLGR